MANRRSWPLRPAGPASPRTAHQTRLRSPVPVPAGDEFEFVDPDADTQVPDEAGPASPVVTVVPPPVVDPDADTQEIGEDEKSPAAVLPGVPPVAPSSDSDAPFRRVRVGRASQAPHSRRRSTLPSSSSSSPSLASPSSEASASDSSPSPLPLRPKFDASQELAEWEHSPGGTRVAMRRNGSGASAGSHSRPPLRMRPSPLTSPHLPPLSSSLQAITTAQRAQTEVIEVASGSSDSDFAVAAPLPSRRAPVRRTTRPSLPPPAPAPSYPLVEAIEDPAEEEEDIRAAPRARKRQKASPPRPAPPPPPPPAPDAGPVAEPITVASLAVHKKKVGELREWLAGAASGASRMLVVYGPPGSGKSTAVYVCAAEAGLAVRSWTDHGSRGTLANSRGAVMEHGLGDFEVPFTSVLQDFEDFLKASCTYGTLEVCGASGSALPPSRGIVVLEDVPRPRDAGGLARVRSALLAVLNRRGRGVTPVVLVLSEAGGDQDGTVTLPSLERWLSTAITQHPAVKLLSVNPVSTSSLRIVLRSQLPRMPDPVLDSIAADSGGDLRHALLSLDMARRGAPVPVPAPPAAGKKKKKGKAAEAEEVEESGGEGGRRGEKGRKFQAAATAKDEFLGTLHALGRLLYAKRNAEGRLDFSPETVMEAAPFDGITACSFLAENCPTFFTDIGDLSRAMDVFSDVDLIHETGWRRGRTTAFPEPYVSTLGSRSVLGTNAHPAPWGYAPIRRPASITLRRVRKENAARLTQGGLGCGWALLPPGLAVDLSWDPAGAGQPGRTLYALPSRAHALDRLPYLAFTHNRPHDPTFAIVRAASSFVPLAALVSPRPAELEALDWGTRAAAMAGPVGPAPPPLPSTLPDDPIAPC